jgi:hypothetical protein
LSTVLGIEPRASGTRQVLYHWAIFPDLCHILYYNCWVDICNYDFSINLYQYN